MLCLLQYPKFECIKTIPCRCLSWKMEAEMINLAIVSDVQLYKDGLSLILTDIEKINVVSIAESNVEILSFLAKNELDIALVDMRMPDSKAIIFSITRYHPKIKIIVMALPENDENYLMCVESGIAGYLSRDSTVEALIDAILTVDKGDLYCPCSVTQYILRCVRHRNDDKKVSDVKFTYSKLIDLLTQREMQIVKLLADGMSNKKIAKNLTIELSTVKNHVHNILVKMGVESRVQIACLLQSNGVPTLSRT